MTFRILSLDGGGMRGVISARMLQVIEQYIDQPMGDYFDLIVGTSTGALLAAGLMLDKRPGELLRFYLQEGENIFPYQSYFNPQRLKLILRYGLSAPKFSDEGLIRAVRDIIGTNLKVADASSLGMPPAKLMITSYDTVRRQPVLFKSWCRDAWYADVPLWKACVCSSVAPTYFPAQQLQGRHRGKSFTYSMIDGGVGANDPTAIAVAEAIHLLRHDRSVQPEHLSMDEMIDEITVLSLGTGSLEQPLPYEEVREWGLIEWMPSLIDVTMDAPSDLYRFITTQIVTKAGERGPGAYLRLQPHLDQKFGAIDNADLVYLHSLIEQTDTYLATKMDRIEAYFEDSMAMRPV